MKRAERLDRVRENLAQSEREFAARLVAAERRLGDARERLAELQRYRADYQSNWSRRIASGLAGTVLRDFQAFLGRLDDAVRQQYQLLSRSEAERDFERTRWGEAAVHVKAVATVVERWRSEARRDDEQRSQRETDERALRVLSVYREQDQ